MVDAHGIVGGNRTVEKRPVRAAGILLAQLVENAVFIPEAQHLALHRGEVGDLGNGAVRHFGLKMYRNIRAVNPFDCPSRHIGIPASPHLPRVDSRGSDTVEEQCLDIDCAYPS